MKGKRDVRMINGEFFEQIRLTPLRTADTPGRDGPFRGYTSVVFGCNHCKKGSLHEHENFL